MLKFDTAFPLPSNPKSFAGVRNYYRKRAEALRNGDKLEPTHRERAIAFIRGKNEVRASEFKAIGVPSGIIGQMCDEGVLVKIAYGRYREADPNLPKPGPDEARALRLRGGPNGKPRDRAIALVREKGEARAIEFEMVGVSSNFLTQLCDEGLLVRVGRGRYREGNPALGKHDREQARALRTARRSDDGPKPSLRERATAFIREKGEVSTAELSAIGIPRCYLSPMCEEGLIVRVAYGRYRLADPKAA